MPAKSRGSLDDEFCSGLPEFAGMGGFGLRVWSSGFRVPALSFFCHALRFSVWGLWFRASCNRWAARLRRVHRDLRGGDVARLRKAISSPTPPCEVAKPRKPTPLGFRT